MKLVYKVSPNYETSLSTQAIMKRLLLGLLTVFIVSVGFYWFSYGIDFAIRACLLMVVAIATAYLTEIIWFKVQKKPIKESLETSFPIITAVILTLMCPIDISYIALGISTCLCLLFGKLAFGGFGQNIFNPAALGRTIISATFMSSIVADFTTGATPTATIAGANWYLVQPGLMNAVEKFGGLSKLLIGLPSGAIGETSALVILLVGIYLVLKDVIDYRVPLVYLTTLFLTTLVIGVLHGEGIYFALFHLLTGGAMFGAVFMMTDPVTNPTAIVGRIIFALGCAFLTVLIRINANLPEGVMYSILMMNGLTPLIENYFDGGQIQDERKNLIWVIAIFIVGILVCALMSFYKTNVQLTAMLNLLRGIL